MYNSLILTDVLNFVFHFNRQSEETFCWALLMSLLVVLPACSLLGAQMELLPRIFFSAWSVYMYSMCTIMPRYMQSCIFTRFGTCENCTQFDGTGKIIPLKKVSLIFHDSCKKLAKIK